MGAVLAGPGKGSRPSVMAGRKEGRYGLLLACAWPACLLPACWFLVWWVVDVCDNASSQLLIQGSPCALSLTLTLTLQLSSRRAASDLLCNIHGSSGSRSSAAGSSSSRLHAVSKNATHTTHQAGQWQASNALIAASGSGSGSGSGSQAQGPGPDTASPHPSSSDVTCLPARPSFSGRRLFFLVTSSTLSHCTEATSARRVRPSSDQPFFPFKDELPLW